MNKNKIKYSNLVVQLVPQIFRLVYKFIMAQKSGGIDKEEAQDLAGEALTVLIFVMEEFDFILELPAEESEDDAEEPLEDEEGEYTEEELEEPVAAIKPHKTFSKKFKGRKK
jgi:hypothetical protein